MREILSTGFRYEFRRTVFRYTSVLIILVTVLVTFSAAAQVSANPPAAERMYSGALFYSDGAYRFDFYAFDEYGSPLSGITYAVDVTSQSGNSSVANLSGRTASDGMVILSAFLPRGSYDATIDAGPPNSGQYWTQGVSSGSVSFGILASGDVIPILSPITSAVNLLTGFSGQLALQIFYPIPNATCDSGCPVYYSIVTTSGASPSPLPESAMSLLGVLKSPLQTFPLAIPPMNNSAAENVQVEIFSPSGSLIAVDANCAAASFNPYQVPSTVSDMALTTFENDMTYLLPLLAIVAAFSVYARDRISGVLESTVVQPVTRQGLATARFLAVVIVLLSGLGTGMALSDELDYLAVGYYLLPSYFVSFYLGFAIALVFFVGIVFLMSHVLRSTAALLAIGMGLYLWFSFFWGTTITSFEASSRGYYVGTQSATGLQVNLDFFNPIQYPALFLSGITNTTPFAAAQYGGTAASWGITPIALGLSALMWTLIPALLLVWRIRTSD
jgi:ABC-2 type transport system permease protein